MSLQPGANAPNKNVERQGSQQAQSLLQPDSKDSKQPSPEQYIIELRLLLSERMHQALENAAAKGQTDCGILEDSVFNDFNSRFGRPLILSKIGFGNIRELIRRKCLDVVELQQLKVGSSVQMGYIPTQGFKAMAGQMLQKAQQAYMDFTTRSTPSEKDEHQSKPSGAGSGGQVSN